MKQIFLILLLTLVMALTSCGGAATPEAIPTIVLDSGNSNNTSKPVSTRGDVIASAIVIPAQEANLAFVAGGNVKDVNVTVGEQVKAGQVMIELENTIAQLEVESANRALRELTSLAEIAAAEEALATAQDELDDAQNKVDALSFARASEALIDNVKGEIKLTEKRLAIASDAYRSVANRADGDPKKNEALVAMTNIQLRLNELRAQYNWYTGKPTEIDAAIVQAKFSAAQAIYQEAQWYLAALKGESIPKEASGIKLAQLQQARDDVTAAQKRLDQTRLTTPISGVVAEVNVIAGEFATPGKILVIVSTMDHLQIKTTDLSERDIIKVKVGDPATITIEALNEDFSGKVKNISPIASTLGGDVVYEVTISFDEQPQNLLMGMSAEVEINVE